MTEHRLELGKRGERLAVKHLRRQGYAILTRNYRVRFGEIDIIAMDADTIVFVEVKTRIGASYGTPFESITPRKQLQLSKVALEFLGQRGLTDNPARFDVIGISFTNRRFHCTASARIELMKNAFDLCYGN